MLRPLPSRASWPVLAACLVAALPFAHGLGLGNALFFRDLSGQFFPIRSFVLEGLRQGELRFWNPFLHEGEPLTLLPIGYPLDLLQLLRPGPWALSLVLALHVPLAAALFARLVRGLGLGPVGAGGGALVYALGGFALSTLNFYVHAQALAWAPLVILTLVRAAQGGRREAALASLAVALALSTTGAEIALQAVLAGLVLALARAGWRRLGAPVGGLALGVLVSAPVILFLGELAGAGERGMGFHPSVVTAHSVHPFTFLQVLIGNLHGELPDLVNRWWGVRFFPLGFPYFVSLYLGAAALALALVGARNPRLPRLAVLLLAAFAAWVCLGRYAGLQSLVELSPWFRVLRFPSKAFFTVHLVTALLVAAGLERLRERPAAWREAAGAGLALGLPLALSPYLPRLLPGPLAWLRDHAFPPGWQQAQRAATLDSVLADARVGGLLALLLGGLAVVVLLRRLAPATGAALAGAVIAADLLRTGVGLNPMVSPAFYQGSPELRSVASRLRAEEARLFTCDPESTREYFAARAQRQEHDWWTFAAFMEAQVPYFNMDQRLATALTIDRTMLVSVDRVLSPEEAACGAVPRVLPRLRAAGVSHLLAVTKLDHPELTPLLDWTPARVAPLTLHLYALRGRLPLREVARAARPPRPGEHAPAADGAALVEGLAFETKDAAGEVLERHERSDELSFRVRADRRTVLLVRDAFAPGWSATLDGQPVPILRADGRHRAVAVPAGESRVALRYSPPGLRQGLALGALGLAAVALLLWPRREALA